MSVDLYRYNALVTEVYDGDTITVDIDLGFGVVLKKQKLRLARINTPEIRSVTPQEKDLGYAARDRVRGLILGQPVKICTYKDKGKFGRWVADVTTPGGEDLTDLLLVEGHGVPYKE